MRELLWKNCRSKLIVLIDCDVCYVSGWEFIRHSIILWNQKVLISRFFRRLSFPLIMCTVSIGSIKRTRLFETRAMNPTKQLFPLIISKSIQIVNRVKVEKNQSNSADIYFISSTFRVPFATIFRADMVNKNLVHIYILTEISISRINVYYVAQKMVANGNRNVALLDGLFLINLDTNLLKHY